MSSTTQAIPVRAKAPEAKPSGWLAPNDYSNSVVDLESEPGPVIAPDAVVDYRGPVGPSHPIPIDLAIEGFSGPVPDPSVGYIVMGGRRIKLLIWPAKTWGWMNFPAGVSRASGGEWFTARVE